jgi:hypothetical protein
LLNSWHAIVGANWDPKFANEIDKWMLVAFAALFVVYHLGASVWFILAYKKILSLGRRERKFIKKMLRASSSQLV